MLECAPKEADIYHKHLLIMFRDLQILCRSMPSGLEFDSQAAHETQTEQTTLSYIYNPQPAVMKTLDLRLWNRLQLQL